MKITDLDALDAVDRLNIRAFEHLAAIHPEKVVERKFERMVDRGFLEYGVSVRRPFFTPRGQEYLKELRP